ncbi:hypothetical protein ODJ79_01720 [Actinoplanes sp. KI2]|uniref:hypothetical protein n=1 Tax=Actinoplanes sp. KI2 TaxID=2983315 RepID=UPI0021D5D395|nr:hypothetical protein [Actinoplanes sp. KI2]MCU7722423.1 hypothetical protein [Actinoplanes sp. KI2]
MAELVDLLVPAEVVPLLPMTDGAPGTTAPIRGGGVYLRGVPVSVAEQWMAQNPGVHTIKRRPAARWFRPRVYTYASVVCLIAAVQVVIVLAVDGAANPWWLWVGGPLAPAAAGVALAYKSIPFPHVRFAG